ncbi:MAG: class I SAM-dependent methyltransferase [Pseudomonadota bacterium]
MKDAMDPGGTEAAAAGVEGARCPGCGGDTLREFYALGAKPTNSCILLETQAEADAYAVGQLTLAFCDDCGFIFNPYFEAEKTEYSGRYEETQGFSRTFSNFHRKMAEDLIERHDLRGKDVLEIGCGKGEFLVLLAELGDNRGVGVDPVVHLDRIDSAAADRLTFHKEFYDAEKHGGRKVDLVACKMTLEHIADVHGFLTEIRKGLGDQRDTVVFMQVPEAMRILREVAFEDIFYEHCSYFTPGSLARAFRAAGFDVHALERTYGDQYLTIEARVAALDPADRPAPLPLEDDLDELRERVAAFPARVAAKIEEWRGLVERAHAAGERVVMWGSGSKAVAFLTTLGVEDKVHSVVDINPHKRGAYMPRTRQMIVAPEDLKEIRPDLVIIMNRIYEEEIGKDLADLGLAPRLVSL